MYEVELVADSCTGQAKVLKGKIQKKRIREQYHIQRDPYDSEGEVVEKVTYSYTFFQDEKEIGEFKQDKDKLFLIYKDGMGHIQISSCFIKILAPLKL